MPPKSARPGHRSREMNDSQGEPIPCRPWDYPDEWQFPEQLQLQPQGPEDPEQGQFQETQEGPQQGQIQESQGQDGPPQGCQTEEEAIAEAIAKAKAKMEEIKAKNGKLMPSVCELCGTEYWGHIGRSSHFESRHSKECQICKKVFSRIEHMVSHKLSVHSENPPKFQCEECGKLFKQKQSLTRHNEEVHKGRYFECEDKLKKHYYEKCIPIPKNE